MHLIIFFFKNALHELQFTQKMLYIEKLKLNKRISILNVIILIIEIKTCSEILN